MSIPILPNNPPEKGKTTINVSIKNEQGVALAFSDLTNPQWQLRTNGDKIVTDCDFGDNEMTSLAVELKGDQLAIFGPNDSGKRFFSFQSNYNNDPYPWECEFTIQKLRGQTNANPL